MATQAQINANRKNAQKSTGPRTAWGKEVVSQNAVKHGLCAKKNVIRTESQEEFDLFCDEMIEDLAPAGGMELMLAKRIVSLAWRLRRAEYFQNLVLDALMDYEMEACHIYLRNARSEAKEGNIELLMGHVINMDFAKSRTLELLLLYERRIENSLYKVTAEFRKTQRLKRNVSRASSPRKRGQDARDTFSSVSSDPCNSTEQSYITSDCNENKHGDSTLGVPSGNAHATSEKSPASLEGGTDTNPASLENFHEISKANFLRGECGVLGSVYQHLRNKPKSLACRENTKC